MDDTKITKHPAFGSINISRCQGSVALYDSPIRHMQFIAITISKAEDHRNLNQHWHFATNELVRIEMSEAQFAEAITSMNTSGTPCTLARYIDPVTKELVTPQLKLVNPDRETFEAEIKEATKQTAERAQAALKALDEILSSKSVKKGDLANVRALIFKTAQDLDDNLVFIQRQFYEAMEKVESKVKTELVATAEALVRSRNLDAKALWDADAMKALAQPKEREEPNGDEAVSNERGQDR